MPERFTTSDGVAIAWYELGRGDATPPIVLQHGFGTNVKEEWIDCGIAAAVAGLGRRVIAVEARGHGKSDHPHDKALYGIARMAGDVSELASHLDLKAFDLVGYSMGAMIALRVATAEPRLRRLAFGGVGEGIILFGGVDSRVIDGAELSAVMLADDPSGFRPFARGFRERAEARGNDRLALGAVVGEFSTSLIPLEAINVPALLIAGATDPLAVHPERLAAAIAGCQLAIVPGEHSEARVSPEFTKALLAFLA